MFLDACLWSEQCANDLVYSPNPAREHSFFYLNNIVLRGNIGSLFSVNGYIGTKLYRYLMRFQFCDVCFTKFIVIGKSVLQILTNS